MQSENGQSAASLKAAAIISEHRSRLLQSWGAKVHSLIANKKWQAHVARAVPEEIMRGLVEVLIGTLRGEKPQKSPSSVYRRFLEEYQDRVPLAEILDLMFEMKRAGARVLHGELGESLEASNAAAALYEAVDEIIARSTRLYDIARDIELRTLQRRYRDIFSVREVEGALSAASSPSEAFSIVSGKLAESFELIGCTVRLFRQAGEPWKDLSTDDQLPAPLVQEEPQFLKSEERQTGGVVEILDSSCRRREVFLCGDVSEEPALVNSGELLDAGVRGLACCPLFSQDRVVGALLLYSGAPDSFRENDRQMLTDVAGVLGPSFERAADLARSLKELTDSEVVARIGRALLELPTGQELLEGAAEAMRQFRDYLEVSLFAVDEKARECVMVAEAGRHKPYLPVGYRQEVGKGFVHSKGILVVIWLPPLVIMQAIQSDLDGIIMPQRGPTVGHAYVVVYSNA